MLSIQIPTDARPVASSAASSAASSVYRSRSLIKDCVEWKTVVYDVWEEKNQASMIYDDVHRRLKRLRKHRVKESKYVREVRVILYGICVLEKMKVGMIHVRLMMMLSQLEDMYTKTDDEE